MSGRPPKDRGGASRGAGKEDRKRPREKDAPPTPVGRPVRGDAAAQRHSSGPASAEGSSPAESAKQRPGRAGPADRPAPAAPAVSAQQRHGRPAPAERPVHAESAAQHHGGKPSVQKAALLTKSAGSPSRQAVPAAKQTPSLSPAKATPVAAKAEKTGKSGADKSDTGKSDKGKGRSSRS